MKKLIAFFLLTATMLSLYADAERISMIIGSTKSIQTPFVIESFRIIPGKSDKVKVEAGESQLRIVGCAVGEVTLVVSGGGMQKDYIVTVKSNLAKTLKKLRTDLDSLTELDISINEDQIAIRGTVTNPEHWKHLMKVLPNYSSQCVNFAVFKPSAETVLNLKKLLQEAGFQFCEPGQKTAVGQLSMQISSDAVVLTGELYSQKDLDKVMQLLATQPWLDIGGQGDSSKGRVRCMTSLSVVETLLQVDIVYAGIVLDNSDALGSNSTPTLSGSFGIIYDLVSGRGTGKTAQFGGNMDATVGFLTSNGVTRTYNAGHVTFANNDPKGGTLHTGNTVYVKVNGLENGSLQNIKYGLEIKVTGGLVSPNRAKLTLDLKNSSLVSASEDSYNLQEDTTSQTVFCDLDKTVVIAGSKKISQATKNSGLPILRSTPVLKWFVSSDVDNLSEITLLILACPRLVKANPDVQIEIPLDQQTAPTYRDSKRNNKERMEENKRHRGSLGWLGWFNW